MFTKSRAATALLVLTVAASAFAAGAKKPATPNVYVAGEDDYRSATGYTVAAMEHCKAINKLARAKGTFNVTLAREHAAEVSRNVASASRHLKGYSDALAADLRGQVTEQIATQAASDGVVQRLSAALGDALKSSSPDRKAVAETVTSLYLAERDILTAHKEAGKTLGIRAATPPHKPTPRKPKTPKDGEVIGDDTRTSAAN